MKTKKLGFGMMRLPITNPDDLSSVDLEKTKEMVDTFMERGFTYFDTAWMYCGFNSENIVRQAVVERYPRDSYTVTTKLHAAYLKTKEDRDAIFNEQLKKCGVEYFDFYLLHNVCESSMPVYLDPQWGIIEYFKEQRRLGIIRHLGFSTHGSVDAIR